MKEASIPQKIAVILIGTLINALGIDLAIHAGYGGATLAVLWMGISNTFPISIGQASLIVAAIMILFCWFYDRKQIHVGTILYQVVYGFALDFFVTYTNMLYTDSKVINFLLMLLGIAIFSIGIGIYTFADFGRGSYDAVMFSLVEKHGWQTKYVRMVLDIFCVVGGVLLGGTFGVCTICTILISGRIIQATGTFLRRRFRSAERV